MVEKFVRSVDSFVPEGNKADKLLAYPFAKPVGSYITTGDVVFRLPDNSSDFRLSVNWYLEAEGLANLEDRIPVVEFGSNSSPYQTREKMGKYGPDSLQPALQTVPKLVGVIPDTGIRWHGKPAQKGSAFAEAVTSDETVGQEAICTIGFYDEQQLAVVHSTEGATYEVVQIDVLAGSDRRPIKAYAYMAKQSVVLLKDGKTVPVKRPQETGVADAMTAEQAVDYMLDQAGQTIGVRSARDLIDRAASESLSGRKALQEPVAAELAKVGASREYSYPVAGHKTMMRADFNGYHQPHYSVLRLMEQVVQPLRSAPEEISKRAAQLEAKGAQPAAALRKARAQLDIAQVLRGRAFTELQQRTGLKEVKKA